MFDAPSIDESLLNRLPLPLAQVFRRALNAKTPLEQHLSALYLAEVGLKLLASAAVVEYAALGRSDPELEECLKNLIRPSLGHWLEIGRRLTNILAAAGCEGYDALRQLLSGGIRDDMPRAAGLDAVLRDVLRIGGGARATVRMSELFDRLVMLRNKGPGHGAPAAHSEQFHQKLGGALLSGLAEVYERLDVLAAKRLVYVSDVRQSAGVWLVQQLELTGANARRLPSLELARDDVPRIPDGERVYLQQNGKAHESLLPLYPLILYEPEGEEVLLLNGRQGRDKADWLCYTSGRELRDQAGLHHQHHALLARLLGIDVTPRQIEAWSEQSRAGDLPADAAAPNQRMLGEFELISELGRGGMGVVYRARQPSLGRQVALKRLLSTGDKSEQRFAREIRALGRVDHPHLVKIYASGSDGDQWFYAMELIEGTPLASVCEQLQSSGASAEQLNLDTWHNAVSTAAVEARGRERPMSSAASATTASATVASTTLAAQGAETTNEPIAPAGPRNAPDRLLRRNQSYVAEVVELLRQSADAVHALHEAKVVHRDIKPGNIMLWADGRQAVVMDLGLAQLLDEDDLRLTRTRQFVGTLRYASPEQVLAVDRIDRRSDVYSLGVTLWEVLTFRPIYGATKEIPDPEVMRRILFVEPERPRKYHPGVSRDLEAVVLRCLEKRPERRYATARELADELSRVLAGEPVIARPVGETERLWRLCRRNPVVSALLAAVVLLLIVGSASVTWKWRAAEANLTRAVAAEKKAADATANALQEAEHARASQQVAEQQRLQALESRYAADMSLAQEAADAGNYGRAVSLLKPYRPGSDGPDLHEFAWRHLCWLCLGDSVATYHNHSDQVLSVAFSPDGKILATAGADGTVQLHNPADLDQPPIRLPSFGQSVEAVEFSPDGRILACATGNPRSAVDDCQVHLWDLAAKRFVAVLEDPTKLKMINAVAYSSDGTRLATASEDDHIRVWQLGPAGNKLIARLPGYPQGANDVSFATGTHVLASGWGNGRLNVWDVDANKQLVDRPVHVSGIIALAFSHDGQKIVISSRDGPIFYWDMKANDLSEPVESRQGIVESVRFSSDGSQFITGGSNGTVVLWDFADRLPLDRFFGHRDVVFSVAFAPHSHIFASASLDRTVKLWDATKRRDVPSLAHQGIVSSLAFSTDGKLLVTAEGRSASSAVQHPGMIYLWNMEPHPPQATSLVAHNGDVNSVAISRDGSLLASGSADHIAIIWDAALKKPLATLQDRSSVTGVRFLARHRRGPFWRPATRPRRSAALDPERSRHMDSDRSTRASIKPRSTSVEFSPDGSMLASSGGDGDVRLWDVAKQNQIAVLEGHQGQCYTAEFSPDGAILATGSHDRTVRIWDIKNRNFRKEDATVLQGYDASINTLAFTPDGKTLAGRQPGFDRDAVASPVCVQRAGNISRRIAAECSAQLFPRTAPCSPRAAPIKP